MLGAFFRDLSGRFSGLGRGDVLLLSPREFNAEIARERVRASRRGIPFCLLTVDLDRPTTASLRGMVRLLHRNLRMTDRKGQLNAGRLGVLLVDTPEMGGRAVLDRITGLAEANQFQVKVSLRVHDPEGFELGECVDEGSELGRGFGNPGGGGRSREGGRVLVGSEAEDAGAVGSVSVAGVPARRHDRSEYRDQRRRGEVGPAPWSSLESHVEISSETPLCERPARQMIAKRALDVFGASVGLVLGGPVIASAMLAIRLTSPGAAIFSQTREGLRGKPFTIYKLRTMVLDAEKKQAKLRDANHRDGPAFKVAHDPRVTRVGRFLRATCVDELPQLWNVLKGDMSLVGPRPLPWHESRACSPWHRRRLDVRPGMTCYWQVNKTQAETFDDWMRLDLRYIEEISMMKDLHLIVKTVAVPVLGRGSQ